ncbi:MAG TPA: energy-coupling factor transporter transmembrane component T [Solirubrobacteraceae bacterium]|nr:energy-coupling factor transporter transmembrane component T [Solirubrobacteraceae bacterium]
MSMLAASAGLAYRRRASPLHAARATVAAAYAAAIALAALLLENPILLGALLAAVLFAAAAAGVGPQLLRAGRRAALPVLAATVLVNALASRHGLTVFARLGDWVVLGQVDLTLEAVVYGLVFGLRLLIVTLACLLAFCAADPDELLLAVRRISPSSALTATLATRLVPILAQDARRLAEAQRCRPDGGARGVRGRLAILRATVAGALDRSLDVAAVLEMRGYGAPRHGAGASGGGAGAPGRGLRRARAGHDRAQRRARRPFSRHDLAFSAAALAILAFALLGDASGAARFDAYPLVSMSAGAGTLALAAAILATALVPFSDRRGIEP